jgi:hypothetical protein
MFATKGWEGSLSLSCKYLLIAPEQIARIRSLTLTSISLRSLLIRSKDKIAVPQVLFGETDSLNIVLGVEKEILLNGFFAF